MRKRSKKEREELVEGKGNRKEKKTSRKKRKEAENRGRKWKV